MSVTDQLLKGVRMDAPDIRALASKTKFHPFTCSCADCASFNKAMNNTKDAPVTEVLAEAFKSVVTRHDTGARKPVSGTIQHDEEGRGKPKRGKKTSEKLLDSLTAAIKR